jgi:hypothetical protein
VKTDFTSRDLIKFTKYLKQHPISSSFVQIAGNGLCVADMYDKYHLKDLK